MVKKKEKKKGRNPCCEKNGVRRGAWTVAEDKILVDFITENGHGSWRNLPKLAGLLRCGKSCRLRWTNYLRPDIKRGPFTAAEENTIIRLQATLGNKWAAIASHMPGRTDNDIKNFWNSHLRKRLLNEPSSSSKSPDMNGESLLTPYKPQWESVQLKASSRLPDEPLLLKTPSASDPGGDFFLRLWNSEVGQSFQNINENTSDSEIAASHSPPFQTLSLTKVESGLGTKKVVEPCKITVSPETSEQNLELSKPKEEAEDVAANSDLSRSNEVDESSDAMLELLLDFPVGDDDMGFLQDLLYDVSTYIQK